MTGQRIAVRGTREAVLEEFEVPGSLAPGELLVEVECSLISPGTELGGYNAAGRTSAYHPGYTAVGRVSAAGPGADEALLAKRVFLFPAMDDSAGCHATHKVLRAGGLAIPVPDDLDSERACFARMVNIALTPYCNAGPSIVESVLVVGLGLVGNMVGQVGRIRGFQVVGIDPDATRRKRALDAGFDAVLDPGQDNVLAEVKRLTGGQGASLTVNATGRADTFPMSIEATATGGEISTLGGARHPGSIDLQWLVNQIQVRHLTLRGGWEMLLPWTAHPALRGRSIEGNLRQAFRWLSTGAVRLDPIRTHTITPAEFGVAYDALNRLDPGYLGVVVRWRAPLAAA